MDVVSPGSNIVRQLPDLCACVPYPWEKITCRHNIISTLRFSSIVYWLKIYHHCLCYMFNHVVTSWPFGDTRTWTHSLSNALRTANSSHKCRAELGLQLRGAFFAPVLVVKGRLQKALGPISACQLCYMSISMRPNKGETAVRGCHYLGQGLLPGWYGCAYARPWVGVWACHLLLLFEKSYLSFSHRTIEEFHSELCGVFGIPRNGIFFH